jgi:hypothetical protein
MDGRWIKSETPVKYIIIEFQSCMHQRHRCSGARVQKFSLHPSGKQNSSIYIIDFGAYFYFYLISADLS